MHACMRLLGQPLIALCSAPATAARRVWHWPGGWRPREAIGGSSPPVAGSACFVLRGISAAAVREPWPWPWPWPCCHEGDVGTDGKRRRVSGPGGWVSAVLWVRHLASHRQAIAAVISCAVLLPHLGRRRLSGTLRPSPPGPATIWAQKETLSPCGRRVSG